ncbi:2,5-diketo-D-gluconic acid reductase [Coprinellus micaceus]|uniref:2,5-diketo-D-gluconic acid reductase n=1 Tax=Coprinellus micaceus TaxID=71717 RepID=A0A4Y7U2U1_COPMI|nr:2,5-diketo-D-gluconic acid reductase [Coprinellus micaceus]
MPFQDIGLNDGTKIPSIAFGSGSVNKGKDVHQYIEQAIETGFSHLDTAQYYFNEESVGKAIRESGLDRSEVYITSKYSNGKETARDSIEASLSKIGVKYLNLYLIHHPRIVPDYVGAWRELEEFKDEGLTRSIGVSNFGIEELQILLKHASVTPAVNQMRLHPYNYAELKPLLEYQAKHGIVTEAYGSLAPLTTYPGGPVDTPLKKAAERLGVTTTQVIFLWVKAKGAVIVTTSSNKQHLEEYLAVGDLPPLTPEEIEAIDAAGAQGPPKLSALAARLARKYRASGRSLGLRHLAGFVGIGLLFVGFEVFSSRA